MNAYYLHFTMCSTSCHLLAEFLNNFEGYPPISSAMEVLKSTAHTDIIVTWHV
jgi:hypothetical protein